MSELTFNDFAASQLGNASKLTKDDKFKKLNAALPDLQKQFGKGFLQKLDGKPRKYPHFSTGILPLDIALGIGGVPRGRIIEIFGAESSGKTTVTLHIIAEAQKRGNVCAFVDAEHALDPSYASSLGVVVDELLFSQPDYGEQALEVANKLISTGAIDIIVIDSVAALVPKAEIAGVIGQAFMGLQARMMSQALRIMTGNAAKHGVTVIFINQTRMKIGAMPHTDPTTTIGGNALKFYASNRMEVKKVTTNKTDDVAVSNRTRVRVIKNKMAPPFRNCEFNIEFGKGVDQIESTFTAGVEAGILIKKGNSYFIEDVNNPDMRIGKSYDESVNSMADDSRRALVKQKILDKYRFEDGMDEMDTKTVSDDLRNIEQEIAQVASTTPPSETVVVESGDENLIINPATGEILDGTVEDK